MATTSIKMPGTPPPWMNALVKTMLRIPGVRRLMGRTFTVLTVTGAVTGNRYATPVQYFRHGDKRVVLSQRKRTWWRNITEQPTVQLLIQGETVDGNASLADNDAARTILSAVLQDNPRVAKFYGVDIDSAGVVDPAGVGQLLEHLVVIVISPQLTT